MNSPNFFKENTELMMDRHMKDVDDMKQGAEDALETREWLESLQEVLDREGPTRVRALFAELSSYAKAKGVDLPFTANTPYINTIPVWDQPPYPGNEELERRIGAIMRWNAMAMVVRANREEEGIGGHIASYASASHLYEVGFNHFFRGECEEHPGDLIYFQGHASPVFMRVPFWRDDFLLSRSTTFGTSCIAGRLVSRRIRIPG